MPLYAYRAVRDDGELIKGEVAAEGQPVVHGFLADRGLTLIDLSERREARRGRAVRGPGRTGLLEFTRALGNLLRAGIPLLQVLEDLEEEPPNPQWGKLIHDLRMRIEGGSTISEALQAHPAIFSDIYASLVQAGEEGGDLPETFARLTAHLEWNRRLREQVREAVSYPLMVLGATAVLIGILTFFVFPRLGEVFTTLDVALPMPTRIVLAVGHFGQESWLWLVGALALSGPLLAVLRRHPRTRPAFDRLLLNLPIAGRLVAMVTYSRFTSTMTALLGAGVTLDRALALTREAVGNRLVADAVGRANDGIQSGDTVAEALSRVGGFPRLIVRMVRVGESSGDLTGMLQNCSEHYEREIPIAMQRLFGAIGPLTIVILALVVGFAAMAVILPMLQLGDAIR